MAAPKRIFTSASLYVGDLHDKVTEASLFEIFNPVGPVASIRVCRDSVTQRSLGYAYVNFHSVTDAERALDTMNYREIMGQQCRIMWSQRDNQLRRSGKGNVFVKNLHPTIDNKTLSDTFSVFGDILSCKVVFDRKTGQNKGFGYVHYGDEASALKAIKGVDGMVINGNKITAEIFMPRNKRVFTNVYIKYIPQGYTKEEIIELLEKTSEGNVDSSTFWVHEYGTCGCFNFKEPNQAQTVVEKLNGTTLPPKEDREEKNEEEQKPLYVARAMKRRERVAKRNRARRRIFPGRNLYVKNLPDEVDDKKLEDMFSEFGEISSVRVMRDQSGKSRNFGFVAFKLKQNAQLAMETMHGSNIEGKSLCVFRHQTKAQRRLFLSRRRQQGQNGYYNQPFRNPANFMQQMPQYGFHPMYPPMQRMPQQFHPQFQQGQMAFQMQQAAPAQWAQQMQPNVRMQQSQMRNVQAPKFTMMQGNQMPPQQYPQSVPRQFTASNQNQMGTATGPNTSMHNSMSQQQLSNPHAQPHSASAQELQPLTQEGLASLKPEEAKRYLGERLFPKIQSIEPRRAGKITGMLLEMENHELLMLLQNHNLLLHKINEALAVLKDHQIKQSQQNTASAKNASAPQQPSQRNISQGNLPSGGIQ